MKKLKKELKTVRNSNMTKLELAIDKIIHTRIVMLEEKMKWYVEGVGREDETYEDYKERLKVERSLLDDYLRGVLIPNDE